MYEKLSCLIPFSGFYESWHDAEFDPIALIMDLHERDDSQSIREFLQAQDEVEVAHLLESLPPQERRYIWEFIPAACQADVLEELDDGVRNNLLETLPEASVISAISKWKCRNWSTCSTRCLTNVKARFSTPCLIARAVPSTNAALTRKNPPGVTWIRSGLLSVPMSRWMWWRVTSNVWMRCHPTPMA